MAVWLSGAMADYSAGLMVEWLVVQVAWRRDGEVFCGASGVVACVCMLSVTLWLWTKWSWRLRAMDVRF